ncbi:MAG: coat protein [Actinomycetota bacterium]
MAISAFVPEVWSAELLVELEKSLVYGAPGVVNRDYEGEISQFGDTVHVVTLADPTVDDYTAHSDITIDEVDDSDQTLVIDEAKYFAFEVDDIEQRQARSGGAILTEQARKAAYVLRDTADQFIASLMATDVDSGNDLGEETLTEVDEAYDYLVDLAVLLDEANVPTEGRFAIVTPAYHGLLLKDDRFVAAGDAPGATTRANGMVGEAAGFSIRKSNNAPDGSTTGKIQIAGYAGATSYAEQINRTEATRKEKGFADIVKGLHLYGAEVFRPTGLATLDAIIDIGGT